MSRPPRIGSAANLAAPLHHLRPAVESRGAAPLHLIFRRPRAWWCSSRRRPAEPREAIMIWRPRDHGERSAPGIEAPTSACGPRSFLRVGAPLGRWPGSLKHFSAAVRPSGHPTPDVDDLSPRVGQCSWSPRASSATPAARGLSAVAQPSAGIAGGGAPPSCTRTDCGDFRDCRDCIDCTRGGCRGVVLDGVDFYAGRAVTAVIDCNRGIDCKAESSIICSQ